MKEHKVFLHGSDEYRQALALRNLVLRQPLGLQFTAEDLKKDEDDLHFGTFEDNKIVACLTLSKGINGRVKLRQMAVAPEWQAKGKGKELLFEAEKYCRINQVKEIYCHARKSAVPFYKNSGYEVSGDEFTEVNIPHFVMEKKLL
jgi:predicted GNAT family N-acyltransferase